MQTVSDAPADIAGLLAEGERLRGLGHLGEAEDVLAEAIRRFPNDLTLALRYAEVAARRGDHLSALERYRAACDRFPQEAPAYLGKGEALSEIGRRDEAEAVFADLTERFPDYVWAFSCYARSASQRNDWSEALQRWTVCAERFPDHALAYVGISEALRGLGRLAEADRVAADAMARFPTDEWVCIAYAQVAIWRGDWQEAAHRWELMLQRFPNHTQAESGKKDALVHVEEALAAAKAAADPKQVIVAAVTRYLEHLKAITDRGLSRDELANGLSAYLSALSSDLGWHGSTRCRFLPARSAEIECIFHFAQNSVDVDLHIGDGYFADNARGVLGGLSVYQWLFSAAKSAVGSFSGSYVCLLGDVGYSKALSFCSNHPEAFLVPDTFFFNSWGYAESRMQIDPQPWASRVPKAFWRGSTSGIKRYWPPRSEDDVNWLPRLEFCARSRSSVLSSHLDVGLTQWVQIPDPSWLNALQRRVRTASFVPKSEFARYKYVFVIDGNSNSWSGLFEALLTAACVLRIESEQGFCQWYYDRLMPWVHFVPIKADLSDLEQQVQWVLHNDERAREIGEAGLQLAQSMDFLEELQATVHRLLREVDRYRIGE